MAYSRHDLSDTIVALATPPGVGAIGVIRLSGPAAIEIVDGAFRGADLSKQASHTVHFGTIRDETGHILDEVLVTLFVAPKSYTGEHVVEVSCHGSDYIIQQLIQLFIQRGARLAQAGEFTLRAFLNGRMDLSQAEAVADLIASSTESSHKLALQQMRGGISDEIQRLRQQLIDFASLIELELDFGEEDVEFANRQELRDLIEEIQAFLRGLLHSFQLGNAIKNGVNTVIAGRPNAGKSTLLNALLNEERAIVSEIAGTTRDTIEEELNIKGVRFRIIDTAGLRDAVDQIEAIGVAKTLEKVRQSSLLVYVYDVLETSVEEVERDLAALRQDGVMVVVVGNKVDPPLAPPFREGNDSLLTPSSGEGDLGGEDLNEGRSLEMAYNVLGTYQRFWPGDPAAAARQTAKKVDWLTAHVENYMQIRTYAREMRRNATAAEQMLWERLRRKQVAGYKFFRQHIIGKFIADFYCGQKQLIIEVDGGRHQLPEVELADEKRTAILNAAGYHVLRFTNEEVAQHLDHVITIIHHHLTQPHPHESPPPEKLPSLERGATREAFLTPKEEATREASPSLKGGARGGSKEWLYISAKHRHNIDLLKDKLYQAVITEQVAQDSPVVSNARHYEALRNASQALDDVLQALQSGITADFVAMDIRRALHHLGEITGEISTDDLLSNIFSRFCIGK